MEQISKQEFLAEFNKIYSDPQKYLVKDGKVDMSAISDLYNKFASAYLHPGMKGIVSEENLPKISVQNLTLLPDSKTNGKSSTGRYDRDHNFIEINAMRFETPSKSALQKALVSVLPILCHEYQHYKQGLYSKGTVNKPKTISSMPTAEEQYESTTLSPEQIEMAGAMLGIEPEKIKQDFLYGDKKNKLIEFVKTVDPKMYNAANKKTNFFSNPQGDRVFMAYYYRRPAEQDARETSIAIFDEFVSDSAAYNKTQNGKLPVFKMKTASRVQKLKNWADMHRQPGSVMETFDEKVKKIDASHFLKYSSTIDQSKLDSSDFKTSNDEGRKLYVMESALVCILSSKSPADREQFLKNLSERAEAAGDKNLSLVVENAKEKLQEQSNISVVSKQERSVYEEPKPQRETIAPTKTGSEKNQELAEQQEKEMQ